MEKYFEITTNDGLTLSAKKSIPGDPQNEEIQPDFKAILCLVHGFGEHQERYVHFTEVLNKAGIAVYSFDLRGHGKSEGKRGHAKKYEYLSEDLEEFIIHARRDYNNHPVFLMGHSFGGHIVANYILRQKTNEITGAILSSPWLKLAFEPPAFKVKLAKMMSVIYPAYSDTSEMDVSKLSKDPEIVKAYENDPLVLNTLTAGLFSSIITNNEWIINNSGKMKIPTLLYHGTADEIISIEGSRKFAANTDKELLTFNELPGVYHEPHNDLEKEQVFDMIINWIEGHL